MTTKIIDGLPIEVADKCDICKRKIETEYPDKRDHILKIEFGYGSKYDAEVYTLVVCDKCFEEHFFFWYYNYGNVGGVPVQEFFSPPEE